jgi:hypothetical protein
MATVLRDTPYHDRRVAERRRIAYPAALRADGMRVSWGGVFGGVLVALGFLLLMTALGVAVGISAAQPGETDAGTLGAGAGIWAGVTLLVALFIGGWVSTRIGAGGAFKLVGGAAQALSSVLQSSQATSAAWITFGALLLSLLAAVLGAMAGRRDPVKEARA